jgi:acetate kinase
MTHELIASMELGAPSQETENASWRGIKMGRPAWTEMSHGSFSMSKPTIILSINAGSSSLKVTLFSVKGDASSSYLEKIAAAEVSGFTDPPAKEKYTRGSYTTKNELPDIRSHSDAFQHILHAFFNDKDVKEVDSAVDITYACHRVVHGGDFATDQFINDDTYHKIEQLEDLAPL